MLAWPERGQSEWLDGEAALPDVAVIISTIISTPGLRTEDCPSFICVTARLAACLVVKTLLSANITNKSASDDDKNNHLPEILASTTACLLSVIITGFLSVSVCAVAVQNRINIQVIQVM